jgi:hypothetical protein
VETADQIEPVVVNAVDRSKPLVPERFLVELLQAARTSAIVELGVRFEQCSPCLSVAVLQSVDRGLYGRIRQLVGDHGV